MARSWFWQHQPRLGEWNVIDDLHGRKMRSSDVAIRWDGMVVPKDECDERHPQDFLRVPPERPRVPFSRPEQTDVFLGRNRTGSEL